MAITSKITKQVELAHEPGESVTVRMLSWVQIKEAREVRLHAVLDLARSVADLASQVTSAPTGTPGPEDPVANYDVGVLLRHGVTAWSYPDPVTPENIADLDDETKDVLAREIVGFMRRDDEAVKNASSPSISPSTGRKAQAHPKTGS